MFHKSGFVIFLFFFLIEGAFTETVVMHLSMSLNTTTIEKNGSSTEVPAKINFSKKDNSFSFETLVPEKDTFFYDESGCFYLTPDGTKINTEEYRSDLEQTCSDLLNYFKGDFGLNESQYKIFDNRIQNEYIQSQWKYTGNGEFIIQIIKTLSDKKGRFVQLSMYALNNTLLAQTFIEKYSTDGKVFYPSLIKTFTYNQDADGNNDLVFTTILELSDVKVSINKFYSDSDFKTFHKKSETSSVYVSEPVHSNSDSISGILVTGAYNFYKKFITDQDIPGCLFYPTCSHYMADCIRAYGPAGIIKGYDRIKRCSNSEKARNLYELTQDGRLIDFAK
jgi:putative component of membrane protein insertase Oxa1/YidC/SpoIIIJ protein YidD